MTLWTEKFSEAIEAEAERHGVAPAAWRAGGRATKENPNKEDGQFWLTKGDAMFNDFLAWWNANNDWYVWRTPHGIPAVEISLESELQGVPVKAFADIIVYDQDGVLSVVDVKTGSSMPTGSMQLGLYAVLCEKLFGVRPQRGYYYDARKATMVQAEGMDKWTLPLFEELFSQFARAVEAEVFLPNVGMLCSSCSVKQFCYIMGGELAQDVDPLSVL